MLPAKAASTLRLPLHVGARSGAHPRQLRRHRRGQAHHAPRQETNAIEPHDLATFTKVIQVNLIGTFLMISKSVAGMQATEPVGDDHERGVVICTSSVAAQDGQIGQVAYAASKGGVYSMTLPIARDLSRDGIRVMTILPGLFLTPMFDSLSDEAKKSLAASVPFPSRLGNPKEYAALAVHICENAMLNGEASASTLRSAWRR
jgi:NAD(P)-dependent dehydrogenase (short-subunit alcohol dehydrogenase family)